MIKIIKFRLRNLIGKIESLVCGQILKDKFEREISMFYDVNARMVRGQQTRILFLNVFID